MPTLTELIERATWQEAVTCCKAWPPEHAFVRVDNQGPLMGAICKRLTDGEGVDDRFYSRSSTHFFIGEPNYWVMTPCAEMGSPPTTTASTARGCTGMAGISSLHRRH